MALSFDNTTIQNVQSANDIVEVVSEHLSLTKKGAEFVGVCPFHDDHKPSMYVSPQKQIFKCFACGTGGDVFKFVQLRENLTFPQSVQRLAERANIEIKQAYRPRTKSDVDQLDPNVLENANKWASDIFAKNLLESDIGKEARLYLEQRSISLETAKQWKIGLTLGNNQLAEQVKNMKGRMVILQKAGLLNHNNADRFRNRLMFTITDPASRVIGFGGRTLSNDPAKYINSPTTVLFDKSNSLFGLEHARHQIVSSSSAVVVEGYTDCIMAHQNGVKNVVATLGTSFTEGHARILKRYARRITLLFDSDTAGFEAADRALSICLKQKINIKVASVPTGKDPCDFIVENGAEKFIEIIENAQDVLDFKWKRLNDKISEDSPIAERKNAVDAYITSVANALAAGSISTIEKGLIVNKIAQILPLSVRQINSELSRRIKSPTQYNKADTHIENSAFTSRPQITSLKESAQKEIVEVILNKPTLAAKIEKYITLKSFDNDIYKQIIELVMEFFSESEEIELAHFLAVAQNNGLETDAIIELATIGEKKKNYAKRFNQAVKTLAIINNNSQNSVISNNIDEKPAKDKLLKNSGNKNPYNLGIV